MAPLLRPAVGEHAREFMELERRAIRDDPRSSPTCTPGSPAPDQGETGLNAACTEAILREVRGHRVLEAGCSRGWLAARWWLIRSGAGGPRRLVQAGHFLQRTWSVPQDRDGHRNIMVR